MTTKENYVLQVFNHQLSRYPAVCHQQIVVPSYETFGIEFVPPQFDPLRVREENSPFYDRIHTYIINSHLKLYDSRKKIKCVNNLKSLFKDLEPKQARNIINKYLALSGRDHERTKDWSFMDDDTYRRRLPHRMKLIHEDLVPIIRKSLNDFAFRDCPIDKDVLFWMKAMTTDRD